MHIDRQAFIASLAAQYFVSISRMNKSPEKRARLAIENATILAEHLEANGLAPWENPQ